MATYDDLLALENRLKIYQMHLQFLAIEICKSKNKLNPSFMWKTYNEKIIPFLLRKRISISIPNVNSQKYGINSLNFWRSVLWNNLQIKLKNCNFLQRNVSCTCSVFLVKYVWIWSYDNFSHKHTKLTKIWSCDHIYYIHLSCLIHFFGGVMDRNYYVRDFI